MTLLAPSKIVSEINRIALLPRRPPVNCERIPGTRLYTPETQALVDVVTERYSRGPRKCNCAEEIGHPCITTLRAEQAWTLWEMPETRGIHGLKGVGSGKCVGAETEVFDLKNARRRLATESGMLAVTSLDGGMLVSREGEAFPSGQKNCCRLLLADGSEIVLSLDHKVYTHRGWVEAAKLTANDFVAVPTKLPEPKDPTSATDDEIALVALMLADGGCNAGTPSFTNETPSVIREFQRLADNVCYGFSEDKSKSNAREFNLLGSQGQRANGKHGTGFRDKWNLFGLAKEKRVKAEIWGLTERQIALFLNRFWACDGHVSKLELECTLASEKLIDDLKFLHLRIGVRSRKRPKKATCNGKLFDAWRLSISGKDALRFFNVVGEIIGKESACARLRDKLNGTKRNTNFDIVPIGRPELYEICDELGFPRRGSGSWTTKKGSRGGSPRTGLIRGFFKATAGQHVSRERFIEFCKLYNYNGRYAHLAAEDVAWERVAKITDEGVQDVFDLSVPVTHNFVANNMVVHNTISGILAPLAFPKCERAVLLAKSSQRLHYELHWRRLYEHFFVPSFIFDDGSSGPIVTDEGVRREFAQRFGRPIPALHFFPYSRLSRPESTDWLERMDPHLVVADESHCIAGESVRSTRIKRFFVKQNAKNAAVDLCDWSGTLIKKGICDTSHLAAFALGTGSPQPIGDEEALAVGLVVDPSRQPDYRSEAAELLHKMFAPSASGNDIFYPVAAVREGLKQRLIETPGVISTRAHAIDCALYLHKRDAPPIPEAVKRALGAMRAEDSERPDGEVIADAAEKAAVTREVALGFYNHWVFKKEDPDEKIQDWFDKRKAYYRELRVKLQHAEIHLDSPMLCYNAAERAWRVARYEGDLPVWPSEAWPAWHEVKDTIWHDSRTTWIVDEHKNVVGDWMAKDAAEWAKEHRGVVWVKSVAFGKKIAELAGINYHGGGPDAERLIMAEKGEKSIVVSIPAHGESRDGLQYLYSEQFITQLPPSGHGCEQLLGRLARDGQKEDQIDTWVWQHVPEFKDDLRRAIQLAEFIEQTTPNRQWLAMADRSFEI